MYRIQVKLIHLNFCFQRSSSFRIRRVSPVSRFRVSRALDFGEIHVKLFLVLINSYTNTVAYLYPIYGDGVNRIHVFYVLLKNINLTPLTYIF